MHPAADSSAAAAFAWTGIAGRPMPMPSGPMPSHLARPPQGGMLPLGLVAAVRPHAYAAHRSPTLHVSTAAPQGHPTAAAADGNLARARAPPPRFHEQGPAQPQQMQQQQPAGQFVGDPGTRRVAPPAAHRTTMPSAHAQPQYAPSSAVAASGAPRMHAVAVAPQPQVQAAGNLPGHSGAPSMHPQGGQRDSSAAVQVAQQPAAVPVGSELSSYFRAAMRQQQQQQQQQNTWQQPQNTWKSSVDPDDDDPAASMIIAPPIESSQPGTGPSTGAGNAPNAQARANVKARARARESAPPGVPRALRTAVVGANSDSRCAFCALWHVGVLLY